MTGRFELSLVEEARLYRDGIRLFNDGLFFEAHDAWEDAWRQVQDKRREQFYRALIRSAVTLELLRRGRAVGVRQVFVDCMQTFEGLPPVFMGLGDLPMPCTESALSAFGLLVRINTALPTQADTLDTNQNSCIVQ